MPTGTFVGQMAAGPGGDVWFLKQQKQGNDFSLELASTLARISPDGTVPTFPCLDIKALLTVPRRSQRVPTAASSS